MTLILSQIDGMNHAGLFFRFSTPNSDAILALTQADFRPNSADFFENLFFADAVKQTRPISIDLHAIFLSRRI